MVTHPQSRIIKAVLASAVLALEGAIVYAVVDTVRTDESVSGLTVVLVFGAGVVAALSGLQLVRMADGGKFSTNFLRSVGLIVVATLGVGLAFAEVTDSSKTGSYALLGTVAGYLATARLSGPVKDGDPEETR